MNKENELPEFPNQLTEIFKLNHFLQNQFLSDTIMLNKNTQKEYFAHKVILSAGSKYFFYSFLANDKDKKLEFKDNKHVIEIPEKIDPKISKTEDDSVIPVILKYLYNNQEFETIKSELNFQNCFSLLSLSQALEISALSNSLGEYISNNILNTENCGKIYYESLVFEQTLLENNALSFLLRNFSNITKNLEEFNAILETPIGDIKKILESDELFIENEKQICDIVLNYIRMRKNIENKVSVEEKKEEEKRDIPPEEKKDIPPEENKEIPPEERKDIPPEEKKDVPPEETKHIPPEEQPKNDLSDNNAKPIFTSNDLDYNITWKKKLERIKERFTIRLLTSEEERTLIECIRFSFLSHSDLLSLSIDPILQNHRDLILEGMSLRLKNYENVEKRDFKIKINPRINGTHEPIIEHENNKSQKNSEMLDDKSRHKMDDSKTVFNPLSSYEDFKNKNNKPSDNMMSSLQNNFNPKMTQNIPVQFYNSMPSNFNPRPPQTLLFDNTTPNIGLSHTHTFQQNQSFELIYEYDFDENGAFYYLGSLGKITHWRNPNDLGQLKVFCSSLGKGRLSDFVGRDLVNLRSMNEPYSYFGVDLGEDRTIIPTAYSIKNRNSSSHVLLCWQLEGSNDKINFEILDSRVFLHSDHKINSQIEKERNILKSPGCTSTWGIDSSIKIKFPYGFRYLILKQIGKNSSGAYNMGLSGFEIYGKCIGKRWSFK